jgi:hypothetical protein
VCYNKSIDLGKERKWHEQIESSFDPDFGYRFASVRLRHGDTG